MTKISISDKTDGSADKPHKHQDLSLHPQNPQNKQTTNKRARAVMPSMTEEGGADRPIAEAPWAASTANERSCLKIKR